MSWKPIVGRAFTPAEFDAYVHTLSWSTWRPRFVTVHNTSAPTLAQYLAWQERKPPLVIERWMQNLVGYYRDTMHWSAGPHLFVAPDKIGVFTPLNLPGVHTPSWNAFALGVETVGEYESEAFADPVKGNLIAALASLHSALGLDPADYKLGVRGLHFHKEDKRTTHRACPGKHIVKPDLVAAVVAKMAQAHQGGEHPENRPPAAEPVKPLPAPGRMTGITMTMFGGTGDRQQSAYGGWVNPDALQVSLPARVPASRRKLRVFHGGKDAVALVNDVGPWNRRDDYWNTTDARPLAEQQHRAHKVAQNGMVPTNAAGLDATPALWQALGIPKAQWGMTKVDWEFAAS
jgi:N-acetylmuramoyl-L-alanine amidase